MAGNRALQSILPLLEARELVLTPSARSAQILRYAFDDHQRASGRRAWEPARVLACTQWTSAVFAELVLAGLDQRLLLNHTQELSLWADIIAADDETASLGLQRDSIADLAELAHQGFALAAAHNALDRLRPSAFTRDERIFARWADTLRRGCSRRGYLPAALLDDALAAHAAAGVLDRNPHIPRTLHLFDLTQPTPSQQSMLAALEARGIAIETHTPPAAEASLHAQLLCPTETAERSFAVRWARAHLGHHPEARIALVVPDLDAERTLFEAELRDILAPELHSVATDLSSTPWAFPSGAPLASLPILACVLDLARWATGPLPLANISALLLSPYLAQLPDRDTAAVFDAQILRRTLLLEPELDLAAFLNIARNAAHHADAAPSAPTWPATLFDAAQRLDPRRPRSYAEWMELLRALADAANWPGQRALTAAEFAATRAFDAALDSVATLDALSSDRDRRVPFAAALHTLELQLRRSREAVPSTAALVEILTPAQLNDTPFDAVLFLHATDRNWPAAARPHPLLNRTLQREAAMPGSHPDLAAAQARDAMATLRERTPTVLFTHAKENADGKLRPSPLLDLSGLTPLAPEALLAPASPPAPLPLEDIVDDLALPALPDTILRGGSSVLKQQAACGFLAFAEMRLRSSEPEAREGGMDPRERGNLIHRVLEAFWREVQTRDALEALSPDERRGMLEVLIDDALAHIPEATGWSAAYMDLVRRRTLDVLSAWLLHELQRGPFTVLEIEKEHTAQLGPLALRVRLDRVEQLPDGGLVYVDYKTGQPKPKDWEGPRPADPQLPLYAVIAEPGSLRGLLFATVRTGKEAGWTGLQSDTGIIPMKRPVVTDLEARTEDWRSILSTLAQDFAAGRAHAAPKDVLINCTHCVQRLLCRRDAAALRASLLEDETAGQPEGSSFTELFGDWND